MEQVLQDLGAAGGITYISLRYFNVAGADRDGRNGEGKEGGTYIRDYIHVEDLAAAHVLALEALEQCSPTAAYNLGSGRGYSVLEVIKAAEKVTGQKVPYRFGPRRPGGAGSLGRKSY
ncbi:NAD-dependent epimerase/dehydratase family protein [Moorella sulfitireducens]|uniref:NAD-dependent epimerase/dehydratase family protein n=1 Tax=Neomoorella sulfitireducens TaxID=2972948 RepID=UPI0021AD1352